MSEFNLTVLNVGHGNCALVHPKEGSSNRNLVIIDMGSTKPMYFSNFMDNLSRFKPTAASKIFIIISHDDKDHSSFVHEEGFAVFISKVSKITKSKVYCIIGGDTIIPHVKKGNVIRPCEYISTKKYSIDLGDGVTKLIVSIPAKVSNRNRQSIIVSVQPYGFLLPGDAPAKSITELCSSEGLEHDIYCLTHHGSCVETNGLIEAINPKIIVVSASTKHYTHPNALVFSNCNHLTWNDLSNKGSLIPNVRVQVHSGDFVTNFTCYLGSKDEKVTKKLENRYIFATADCGNIVFSIDKDVLLIDYDNIKDF